MKKQKKKQQSNLEIKNVQNILLYTLAFLIFMYIVTTIITGQISLKKDKPNDEPTEASIQYKEILAGEVFKRPEKEYYVVFLKFDNNEATTVQTIIDNYSQKNKVKVYLVDLSKNFNKSIYTETTSKVNTNNISNLKVKDYTLIKIKSSKNIYQLEGRTNVVGYFTK